MTKWTKEPPTESGWYWWRSHTKSKRRPLNVDRPFGDFLEVLNMNYWHSVNEFGGEWWPEPIQEPE